MPGPPGSQSHSESNVVRDHLRFGARLNPRWDAELAKNRIADLGLDLSQRAGKLSGGQRAQLALTLAIAKRPELLLLDEPVASLDPLARREFLQILMEKVADGEVSIVLSSHLVSDVERVCVANAPVVSRRQDDRPRCKRKQRYNGASMSFTSILL